MDCAGILLTGGTSRRMGRDKATLEVPHDPEAVPSSAGPGPQDGRWTLARRTARMLAAVAAPTVEVGPGVSGLPAVLESPSGSGPLSAVAAGWAHLGAVHGWAGPALVVATDLPLLTPELLGWLAGHPAPGSVIPVAGDRVQPLCARYSPTDLARAADLANLGARAMSDLIAAVDPLWVGPAEWAGPAGSIHALDDADTPAEFAAAVARLDDCAARRRGSP